MSRYIRGKTGLGFDDFQPRASRQATGGAGAADLASVSEMFGALNAQSTDWGSYGQNAIAADGIVKRAEQNADALIKRGEIQRDAAIEIGRNSADQARRNADRSRNSSLIGNIVKVGVPLLAAGLAPATGGASLLAGGLGGLVG